MANSKQNGLAAVYVYNKVNRFYGKIKALFLLKSD